MRGAWFLRRQFARCGEAVVALAESDRATGSAVEVLDRILDKGIVIDAEVRLSLAGLVLASVEARIVVAGIETYLENADLVSATPPAWWTAFAPAAPEASAGLPLDSRRRGHKPVD